MVASAAPASVPPAPPARAAERIGGRYLVLECLGEGGAGAVYRAFDESAGRPIALKRLHARARGDSGAALRFRQEFHTLARLVHPRIVEVYEYAEDDDGPFYTMELLDGDDVWVRAPAPPAEACRWLRDVASALAFLHARRLLHCDLGGRNVRSTSDGRAKLIDFGALATMGWATEVIGTPPFMPPEAVRGLPLDERSDLYGLGALAYWLLTGRHAYGAHNIHELSGLWQRRPPPPSSIASSVPPALDDLVLSLLSLDPLARPASAAEAMDRLGAVVGLEPAMDLEVAQSYVRSAGLVGREHEMEELRAALRAAIDGNGRAVIIEGASGIGKTRLLRELGLETQLVGALVLTAGTGASRGRAYGLVRQLIADVLRGAPELAVETLQSRAPVLARVAPEILTALGDVQLAPEFTDPREQHTRIQGELVGWLLDLAARKPLAILVDDLQNADEASTAMLASLAHGIRTHPVLAVATLRSDTSVRAAGPVTKLSAQAIAVRPRALDACGVQALVSALFGDVRYARQLSKWMHRLGGGSPMLSVELARHLVEQNIVRYVDGIWVVPAEIDLADVPRQLSEAMDARVRNLGESARAFAEALSVHSGELPLELCVRLATDSEERVFALLNELAAEEVLVGSATSYRFRHDSVREAVLRSIDADRRRLLHMKMAEALQGMRPATPEVEVDVGFHLYHAGDSARAAGLLERGGLRLCAAHAFADAVEPLETALGIYEGGDPQPARKLPLSFALVVAGYMADRELLVRHADRTLQAAAECAGLDVTARLRRFMGARGALLSGAAWGRARRWLVGAHPHGPNDTEALRIYVMSVIFSIAAALAAADVARMGELLALLEPVSAFKGTVAHSAYRIARLLHDFMAGRHARIRENASELVRALRVQALDELDRKLIEGGARLLSAMVPAANGDPTCLEDIEAAEGLGLKVMEVGALQARTYFHLCRGEVEAARRTQSAHEVLSLQVGSTWQMQGWRAATEALAHGHMKDALGLKRSIEELAILQRMEGFSSLEANLELARGEYLRERGQLVESRRAIERALQLFSRGETVYEEVARAAYADTLVAVGDYQQAEEVARRTIALCERRYRVHAALRCGQVLAHCEAARGNPRGAASRLDALIEGARAVGNPAVCGALHASRARIARDQGDVAAHAAHVRLTEQFFRSTKNPVLVARAELLAKGVEGNHRQSAAPQQVSRPEQTTVADGPPGRAEED